MNRYAALTAPSLDDFEQMARAAWAEVPGSFRRMAGDVVFRVEDAADDDVLDEMEIEDPLELTGLFQGVDLTQRSSADPDPGVPMVFLYRLPILFEWADRGDVELYDLILHIVVHEVGHHFGLTDEQMDEILDRED